MANIDQRVVELKFNNAQFQKSTADTMSLLDRLKDKLNFSGATKGMGDLGAASKKVDMSHLGSGIESVSAKFGALQVAGIAAFGTLVSKATAAGASLVKSFTIAPITQGFGEYELKMKSIQTILANTARHGTQLATVNSELNKLNTYADKTIYNFAEMTKNASLFTASGMKIEEATTAIKGFSNAAAASGTGAEDAARAAVQLSQGLNKGKITMEEWRSFTNAGMGNKNMEEGLIALGDAMGTVSKAGLSTTEVTKGFTKSLEKGWVTSDVMSTYLRAMSGDMTDAEFAATGLDQAQITMLKNQAKMGLAAATEVRTFSALMGTLKEAVASGWAESFEIIFGNFDEATKLFSGLSNYIGAILGKSSDARNKMLQDWKNNNGRHFLLVGLQNAGKAFMSVLSAIKQGFRDVFPPTTGKQLADLSERFMEFTKKLELGSDTFQMIRSTFQGVFAVLSVGKMILEGALKAFFGLFMTVGEGATGLLSITAVVGEFLGALQQMIQKTGLIEKFFTVLMSPLLLLKPLIGLVSDLAFAFNRLIMGDVSGFGSAVQSAFGAFGDSMGGIVEKFHGFTNGLSGAFESMAASMNTMWQKAANSGNTFLSGIIRGFQNVLMFLSGFFADARGTISQISEMFGSLSMGGGEGFLSGFDTGVIDGIKGMINSLVTVLKDLRTNMDFSGVFSNFNSGAETTASGGIAVLSGAFAVISAIFSGLGTAFRGIGNFFGPILTELGGFFTEMIAKVRGWMGDMDMLDLVALINIAALVYFVKQLGGVFGQAKGMFKNIKESFGQLTDTLKAMQNAIQPPLIVQIAVGVVLLVGALALLASINPKALGMALGALTIVFAQIVGMIKIIDKMNPQGSAAGLVSLALAVLLLAGAIKLLGSMPVDVLVQGGIAIGVMMLALAGVAQLMTGLVGLPAAAAGLLILSIALNSLAATLLLYAAIPFSTIQSSLEKLVPVLAVLIIAMAAASGTLAGAAALMVVAAALGVLVVSLLAFIGAMKLMAAMPMKEVEKAMDVLVKMAQGIAKATLVLALVIPFLAALAVIAVVAGAGVMMLGVGLGLLATGLAALAGVGAAAILGILALLPMVVLQLGLAFKMFVTVLGTLVEEIIEVAGKIIVAFAQEVARRAPELYAAGLDLLIGFLEAFRSRISDIVDVVSAIVVTFLDALSANLPDIIASGVNFILSFIEGLALAIRGEKERTGQAGSDLAMAIVEGMISGLGSMKDKLVEKVKVMGRALVIAFKSFLGINSPSKVFAGLGGDVVMGLITGIGASLGNLMSKGREMAGKLISSAIEAVAKAVTVGATFIVKIIAGITSSLGNIRESAGRVVTAAIIAATLVARDALNIGKRIIEGIVRGIGNGIDAVVNAAKSLARGALSGAMKVLGIKSPSKEFEKIGQFVNEGFRKGLVSGKSENSLASYNTMKEVLTGAMKAASEDIAKHKEHLKSLTASRDADTKSIASLRAEMARERKAKTLTAADTQSYNDKIAKLTASRNADNDAIKKVSANLTESTRELNLSKAAHAELTKNLADENSAISKLSVSYDALNEKVKDADKVLEDAIKTRDDYAKSIKDQYDNMPDVMADSKILSTAEKKTALAKEEATAAEATAAATARTEEAAKRKAESDEKIISLREAATDPNLSEYERGVKSRAADYEEKRFAAAEKRLLATQAAEDAKAAASKKADEAAQAAAVKESVGVTEYIEGVKAKTAQVVKFATLLQTLRDQGLNDDTYQELLAKGVDAMPFMEKLAALGGGSIAELNKVAATLKTEAAKLGNTASKALYQAGVDSAQGIAKGLHDTQNAIYAQIEKIAEGMIKALKKKLGIKSPSVEFAKLGAFASTGMADGLRSGAQEINSAADFVAEASMQSMRDTLARLSEGLSSDMDLQPTIAPILDLSNVKGNAEKLNSILTARRSLALDGAYSQAVSAYNAHEEYKLLEQSKQSTAAASSSVQFVQNNHSPKALSPAEIYRQTKNQLSIAKGALV